jgi:hypothetical protein
MWFSKLTPAFMEEIYKKSRYRKIIDHTNFNPRLVAFITDYSRVPVDSADKYWHYIEDSLSNPKDIWSDCFKRQSNIYVRNLVCLCVFNGGAIQEDELKDAYTLLNELEGIQQSSYTMKDFDSMIRLCTRAFLNRNRKESKTYYTLFNPSLADYVVSEFTSDTRKLTNIFHALRTVSAIDYIGTLAKESIIDSCFVDQIKQDWFDYAITASKSTGWGRAVVEQYIFDLTKHEQIIQFAKTEITRASAKENMTAFLNILSSFKKRLPTTSLVAFLKRILLSESIDRNELAALASFVELYFPSDSYEYSTFCQLVLAQIESDVADAANSMDLSDCVKYVTGYDGDPDIEYNSDKVYEKLQESAVESLNELNCAFLECDLNLDSVTEGIDADDMLNNFFESSAEPDYENDYSGGRSMMIEDAIDDLFERQ